MTGWTVCVLWTLLSTYAINSQACEWSFEYPNHDVQPKTNYYLQNTADGYYTGKKNSLQQCSDTCFNIFSDSVGYRWHDNRWTSTNWDNACHCIRKSYFPTSHFSRPGVFVGWKRCVPCKKDERVQLNQCVACPAGETNAAGDNAAGPNTKCDKPCQQNERAKNNTCVSCPVGQTNAAGDDPNGPNTKCDQPCNKDERVQQSKCSPCPVGETNAAGDDPNGGDTQCDQLPPAVVPSPLPASPSGGLPPIPPPPPPPAPAVVVWKQWYSRLYASFENVQPTTATPTTTTGVTYEAAVHFCEQQNGVLARLEHKEHIEWLNKQFPQLSASWVAARNDHIQHLTELKYFRWDDNSYVRSGGVSVGGGWRTPTTSVQPSSTTKAVCTLMSLQGLITTNCDAHHDAVICMKMLPTTIKQYQYFWVYGQRNKADAEKMCGNYEAAPTVGLPVVQSDEQKTFQQGLAHMYSTTDYWFWLQIYNSAADPILTNPDYTNWKWTNGDASSYPQQTLWAPKQPDHREGTLAERCAVSTPGGFISVPCDDATTTAVYTLCQFDKPVDIQEISICSGDTKQIECKAGDIIKIWSSFYGRVSRSICPSPHITNTDDCWDESKSIERYTHSLCDNHQNCSLPVHSNLWSHMNITTPPVNCRQPNSDNVVMEYLNLRWQCVKRAAPPVVQNIASLNTAVGNGVGVVGALLGLSAGGSAVLGGAGQQLALLGNDCTQFSGREALHIAHHDRDASGDGKDYLLTKYLNFTPVTSYKYVNIMICIAAFYLGVTAIHVIIIIVAMKTKQWNYSDAAGIAAFPYLECMLWDTVAPMIIFCGLQMMFHSTGKGFMCSGIVLLLLIFIIQLVISVVLFKMVYFAERIVPVSFDQTPNGYENTLPPIKLRQLLPKWYWCSPDHRLWFKQYSYFINSTSYSRWGWLYPPFNTIIVAAQVAVPFLGVSCPKATLTMGIITSGRLALLLLWRPYHDVLKNVLAILVQGSIACIAWGVYVANSSGHGVGFPSIVDTLLTVTTIAAMTLFFVWSIISALLRSRYVKSLFDLEADMMSQYGDENMWEYYDNDWDHYDSNWWGSTHSDNTSLHYDDTNGYDYDY